MPTFTPSFNDFQAFARRLKLKMQSLPDPVLKLRNLLKKAAQTPEASFVEQIHGYLENCTESLEQVNYEHSPDLLNSLGAFMASFADYIQKEEPALAAAIKDALKKDGEDKIDALLKLLNDQAFYSALAANLKARFTPSHLNKQEQIEASMDEMRNKLCELNIRGAEQVIYNPDLAWVMYLLSFIFDCAKMASMPPLRASMPEHSEPTNDTKIIRYPMPA